MTAVTQKISRFTGGISDQPDEQKLPGQVRDAVNCIPDVVQGLIKRPGMNLISRLSTHSNGRWFFIDKANNFNTGDRYVGQIDNLTGKVKIWSLDNGKEMDLCYTDVVDPLRLETSVSGFSLPADQYTEAYSCVGEPGESRAAQYKEYFKTTNIDDLQTLTINDYTFVCNRTMPVQMSKSNAEKRDPEATVEIRSIAGLTDYKLEFTEPKPTGTDSQVLNLSVQVTGLNKNAPPDPAICPNVVNRKFENVNNLSEGKTGTGLGFTIETSAVKVPQDQPDGSTKLICVYSTQVTLDTKGNGWKVGDTVVEDINGARYVVKVEEIGEEFTTESLGEVNVTSERENPKVDDILDELETKIEALGVGIETTRIGNGLYMVRPPENEGGPPRPFSVISTNSIVMRALSSTAITDEKDSFLVQANAINEVPLQTKHNLPFFIRNSFSDNDDYYVQFKGNNDADGPGTYVEIAKPGIPHLFEPSTMPHGMLRLAETRKDSDGDTIVTFLVTSFQWAKREAGDDVTNPRPSFAPDEESLFGRPINNMSFFRNRFVLLNDENVVASTAGDFFNFWAKTALTISPSDPIDLQVSNDFPAELFNAQATTAGLVVFSENAQFLFGTENDVLSPSTARTSLLCTYNFNRNSNPINLGTTVGFVSGIGRYTRFYEMANITRDQEPEVVEQSKVVERLMPGDYYEIGISKDNQAVMFGKRNFNTVWMFRYFNTGEKRAQSAWCNWVLSGDLISHSCINDSYFAVVHRDNKVFLLRGDYRALESTVMLDDANGEEYRTFLDYATNVDSYTENKQTNSKGEEKVNSITINMDTINFPFFEDSREMIRTVVYDPKTDEGYIVPTIWDENEPTLLKVPTKIEDQKLFIGYNFKMNIDLPQFFIKQEQGGNVRSWDTANVIIQRVKLNLGRIGHYETTLTRLGRPSYTQVYEAKPMDEYSANELGYLADYEQTTPVYQRNTTFRMSISSESPAPAVLYSATWEGQYQENYVKRL